MLESLVQASDRVSPGAHRQLTRQLTVPSSSMKGYLEQDLDTFGDKFGISLTDNTESLQIFIAALC